MANERLAQARTPAALGQRKVQAGGVGGAQLRREREAANLLGELGFRLDRPGEAEAAKGGDVGRIGVQRTTECLRGRTRLAEVQADLAKPHPGRRVSWLQVGRLFEGLHGLVMATQFAQRKGEVDPQGCHFRKALQEGADELVSRDRLAAGDQ